MGIERGVLKEIFLGRVTSGGAAAELKEPWGKDFRVFLRVSCGVVSPCCFSKRLPTLGCKALLESDSRFFWIQYSVQTSPKVAQLYSGLIYYFLKRFYLFILDRGREEERERH